MGCDPAFFVVCMLPVLGGSIGNSRALRLKNQWTVPAVIWSALIAESGSMKSPAQELVASPLKQIQLELSEAHEVQWRSYRSEMKKFKRELSRWNQSESQAEPPDEPIKPVHQRVIVDDITTPGVMKILHENPRGVTLIRDEFGGWHSRVKKEDSVERWNECYHLRSISYDRGNHPVLFMPNAAVSICGTIQPGIFADVMNRKNRVIGLAARFLIARPPTNRKQWSNHDLDSPVVDAYRDLIRKLCALPMETLSNGRKAPFVIDLKDDAMAIWSGYFEIHGKREHVATGDRKARLGKMDCYAARLALVHHVVSCVARGLDCLTPLGCESMLAGISMAEWFENEADRVYSDLDEDVSEDDIKRKLERIKERGGRISVRDFQKSDSRRFKTSENARAFLALLGKAGYGVLVFEPCKYTGKSVEVFYLHDARRTTVDLPSAQL